MEQTDILLRPIISEKSLNRAASSWYTFAVFIKSNKNQIKKAVEQQFKVTVLDVKTMINKGKQKRVGRRMKTVATSAWKKAQVLLPKEQKIDLFEVPTTSETGGKHE